IIQFCDSWNESRSTSSAARAITHLRSGRRACLPRASRRSARGLPPAASRCNPCLPCQRGPDRGGSAPSSGRSRPRASRASSCSPLAGPAGALLAPGELLRHSEHLHVFHRPAPRPARHGGREPREPLAERLLAAHLAEEVQALLGGSAQAAEHVAPRHGGGGALRRGEALAPLPGRPSPLPVTQGLPPDTRAIRLGLLLAEQRGQ